jgi:TctA family transporter
MTTFGVSGFVTRPIALVLLFLTLFSLAWPTIRKRWADREGVSE